MCVEYISETWSSISANSIYIDSSLHFVFYKMRHLYTAKYRESKTGEETNFPFLYVRFRLCLNQGIYTFKIKIKINLLKYVKQFHNYTLTFWGLFSSIHVTDMIARKLKDDIQPKYSSTHIRSNHLCMSLNIAFTFILAKLYCLFCVYFLHI